MKYLSIFLFCLWSATGLNAQLLPADSADLTTTELSEEELINLYTQYVDSLQNTLTFLTDTTVSIGEGMATLAIPEGFSYLSPEDAATVLVDLWGNPPNSAEHSLGMLFPAAIMPADPGGYGIDIFYTEDGFIDDEDAADIDYDDLLTDLQEDALAENEVRAAQGYEAITLEGWAANPHYDQTNKRLHWAQELHFDGQESNTLNYNILFLGRRGFLTMNVIGDMSVLPEVNDNLDGILASVAYTEGHRYADFDPSIDEVAAYGIGALVAGKVLAKTGLLASIGIFLAKGWKLIAVAGVALMGFLRKLGGRGE